FDRKLKIERWDGTPGVKASGFRFRDGEVTLGDGNVVATAVDGKRVLVTLDRPISLEAYVDYGSGNDGQGQPVLRDAQNGLPVTMVFGQRLARP
ncbi:MAG: hypothetical protein HY318_04500, partial [Armatimonadetes bacterium]|nr:hypothetical protein [Armatimonadota bacterium]